MVSYVTYLKNRQSRVVLSNGIMEEARRSYISVFCKLSFSKFTTLVEILFLVAEREIVTLKLSNLKL